MHSAWRHYSLACLDSAVPTEPRMSSVCSDLLTVAAKLNAWIKYFVQWFSLLQWQRVWGHKSALTQRSLQSCTCEHGKCKKVLNTNIVGLKQLILCPTHPHPTPPPAYMLKAWCHTFIPFFVTDSTFMVAAMSIELGFSTWKRLIQCFEDRSRCILLKGLGVQHVQLRELTDLPNHQFCSYCSKYSVVKLN